MQLSVWYLGFYVTDPLLQSVIHYGKNACNVQLCSVGSLFTQTLFLSLNSSFLTFISRVYACCVNSKLILP